MEDNGNQGILKQRKRHVYTVNENRRTQES